jgi:hypothetical protein
VRFVCDDPNRSAKAILGWLFGRPPFTYAPGYCGIKDRLELGIDRSTAVGIASRKGAAAGRDSNKSLVEAFFDYDDQRQFKSKNAIAFEREYFRISREIIVPVSPLSIIREKGISYLFLYVDGVLFRYRYFSVGFL